MELRERLRFSKGGYSLPLKFSISNELSYTFVTKRDQQPFHQQNGDYDDDDTHGYGNNKGKYIFCFLHLFGKTQIPKS